MEESLVVQILFAAAAIVAGIAAVAKAQAKVFKDKVNAVALAVALAATAFFVKATDFLS